ncbi:alpha/beta hydrolase [Novosphingobium sp. B 225]|uniref:alpha/beta hydrolase n=1 Tax=Novosphingobium sp. B 225 TaxID=1961849 RepID=UPI001124EF9F|nr:alpha/beta hydrolase [Novosphingobium sp. B 225]
MMKRVPGIVAALALLAMPLCAAAQPVSVPTKAPAEPGAIPLYGDQTPGSASSEVWGLMGGRVLGVRNVTRPTLTPVLPARGKANGAAVVVAPGGAFMGLAIDHEGWQVARALAARGITAFVLKYRLIQTPVAEAEAGKFMGAMLMKEIGHPMEGELLKQSKAPEDARTALAMVRANAAKWGIDPRRVGIIGFSAGAMTSRRVALDAPAGERPDFVGYIYGPQDAEPVPADAPPLFDAIALDDGLFPSKGFPIAAGWLAAKRPVEIHGYQTGDHGFGLGKPGTTTTLLIDQFTAWLAMQGFLKPKAAK